MCYSLTLTLSGRTGTCADTCYKSLPPNRTSQLAALHTAQIPCTTRALPWESLALCEGQYSAMVGHRFKSRSEGMSVFLHTP